MCIDICMLMHVCAYIYVYGCSEGYWGDRNHPEIYHKCWPRESCLGGTEFECREGRTGTLCAICADGYFMVTNPTP